jgi:hypothetical protein
MSIQLRSVCPIMAALTAIVSVNHSIAKADLYRVDATVVANFTTGPVSTATSSFSFEFDNAFVTGAPFDEQRDFPISQFQTSLNPIGTTTFSPSNVEGVVRYEQGILRRVLVGGVGPTIQDESAVNGNNNDFFVDLFLRPSFELDNPAGVFVWANSNSDTYSGNINLNASSLTITLLTPEPASALLLMFALCAATAIRRRSF